MRARAVILDIYKTVLEVKPPVDADAAWQALCRRMLHKPPPLDLAAFSAACDSQVALEHSAAKAVGIEFPEIYWPDVVMQVLPELREFTDSAREEFLYQQTRTWHDVRLMPGAAEALRHLDRSEAVLGIASNAQPYTLRELDEALATVGLTRDIFAPELCLWSFESGFSKPNPHVFRQLTHRLRHRGIRPNEIVMVGDRQDNDIAPALAQGWQTWHFSSDTQAEAGGDWARFVAWLEGA